MDGREAMRVIASGLHSKFRKETKERRALTYCAPFFDKEANVWTLELKKKGSKDTAQLRLEHELNDSAFETMVRLVNNYLTEDYEQRRN